MSAQKYHSHSITGRSVSLIFTDGEDTMSKSFTSETSEFGEIKKALAEGRYDDLPSIALPEIRVAEALPGAKTSVVKGRIVIDGDGMPDALDKKIKALIDQGLDATSVQKFWNRLKKNPSENSRKHLYRYIAANGISILPDGRFVAYKGVNKTDKPGTYSSCHASAFLYTLGAPASQPRSQCSDNPNQDCGPGLHAAPWKYVRSVYGSHTIIAVIIDPEHMTSVPFHETSQKLRCCEMLPTMETTKPIDDGTVVVRRQGTGVVAKAVDAVIRAIRGGDKAEVLFTTDRITIPSAVMAAASITATTDVTAVVTDKRARFILLFDEDAWEQHKDSKKRYIFNKSIKMLGSGACSVRNAVLREAQIDSKKGYAIKSLGRGIIEIREA